MYDEELESESGGSGRSLGRTLWNLLLLLVFLALAFGLLYLVAERNARQYFLAAEEGELVVKRGVFFPVGDTPFLPEDDQLRRAYAPVPIPEGEGAAVPERASFQERAELDRRLMEILLGWARERIPSDESQRLERGIYYVERAQLIPTASSKQRAELARLEAEVAWYDALRLLEQAHGSLQAAASKLAQARSSGDETARRSAALQGRIQSMAAELAGLVPSSPLTGPPSPSARPAAPGAAPEEAPAAEPEAPAESGRHERGPALPEGAPKAGPDQDTEPEPAHRTRPAPSQPAPRAEPAPSQPAPRAEPAPEQPAPRAAPSRAPTGRTATEPKPASERPVEREAAPAEGAPAAGGADRGE